MRKSRSLLLFTTIAVCIGFVHAQSTQFTYQGKLQDSGVAANGSYDIDFALYDSVSGGNQVGSTVSRAAVSVTGGIFTVSLDFGDQFPGAARYLEIRVKPTGQPTFSTLSPRQPISTTPYSVRSLTANSADNATKLGGISASNYVMGTDPRLDDARIPLAGSPDYIQNGDSPQVADFTISGSGVADTFQANQYYINGQRVLSTPNPDNTFVGIATGKANTTGGFNSFFGSGAGSKNTAGASNSFFGAGAGVKTVDGTENSFFGANSGVENISGTLNSFFGSGAGNQSTGSANAFFGQAAGYLNNTGSLNSFFGRGAGGSTTSGNNNTFVGARTGLTSTTGSLNSLFGYQANTALATLTNATAVGANAYVGASNSLVLGSINGINGAAADTNVGIGTTTPAAALDVVGGSDPIRWSRKGVGKTWAWEVDAAGTYVRNATDAALPLSIANGGNVGIGTSSPISRLQIVGSAGDIQGIQIDNREIKFRGDGVAHFSLFANRVAQTFTLENTSTNFNVGTPGNVLLAVNGINGNVGIAKSNPNFTLDINGTLSVGILGTGGSDHICRISFNQLALCSSSIRYKTNVSRFSKGLALVNAFRPVTFDWKADGKHDLGLVAEDVEKISPLLVTYNDGKVEGVKYDRIGVVLINAIKEQQAEINELKRQVRQLQATRRRRRSNK